MFDKKKNKIIILGKNGFIASEIVKAIKNHKFKYLAFSKNDINLLNKKNLFKLNRVIKKSDLLIFCSALAPVKSYDMYFKNIKMVENFLTIKNLNKLHSICYLSSDAVFSDTRKRINENSDKNPENLHGFMHYTREKLLKLSHKKVFCIRPTLVFGKNDPHNSYGPNKFIRSALKNKKIEIFGNGEELRDHIHVKDIANTIISILKFKRFEDINIVTGKVISFVDIARQIKIKYKQLDIIKIKRKIPQPHNGFRAFDNKKMKDLNINPLTFKEYCDQL
jgi:nucleoside-diphosphate-sugar epimerase